MERNIELGHRTGSGIGDHLSLCGGGGSCCAAVRGKVAWCCVGEVGIGRLLGRWDCEVSRYQMYISFIPLAGSLEENPLAVKLLDNQLYIGIMPIN